MKKINENFLGKTIIFTLIVVSLLFNFQGFYGAEVNIDNSTNGGILKGVFYLFTVGDLL